MTDVTLNNITSGYNIAKMNDNFQKIQTSINTDLLNLAGGNNTMGQNIDMNSFRVFNLNDAVAMLDAVNLRQLLTLLDQWSAGGKNGVPGMSVQPQLFTWVGDGVTTDIPLPGADVSDSSFYDTAQNGLVLEPEDDFTILMFDDVNDTIMRLKTPTPNGVKGFTVLRGYARPYSGDAPITTVNNTINNITGSAGESGTLNHSAANNLLIVNSDFDTFITISVNTGDEVTDWRAGDFFSVLQAGDGKVEVKIEGGGNINPSPGFLSKTRGKYSIISYTNYDVNTNTWAASGDLQQETAESLPEVIIIPASDETTALTEGNGKAKIRAPYPLSLTEVRASLSTAQGSGDVFTVDIKVNSVSILSTLITVDNTKLSSKSSVNQPVISSPVLADDDEVRIDITQVGSGDAAGLKVYLLGLRV